MVDDLSYNAGVATDYSREIHYDPTLGAESRAQDKKESIKELDQIIKEINEITYYHFSEIILNVNKLKIAIQDQSEDSQSEDSQIMWRNQRLGWSLALGAERRAKDKKDLKNL